MSLAFQVLFVAILFHVCFKFNSGSLPVLSTNHCVRKAFRQKKQKKRQQSRFFEARKEPFPTHPRELNWDVDFDETEEVAPLLDGPLPSGGHGELVCVLMLLLSSKKRICGTTIFFVVPAFPHQTLNISLNIS